MRVLRVNTPLGVSNHFTNSDLFVNIKSRATHILKSLKEPQITPGKKPIALFYGSTVRVACKINGVKWPDLAHSFPRE